ncbi:MAG: PadR family transcriptional regulator [Verrucomicrobia bacterium]|jgi:PadR family transcriptional regulator, regulatory protein PadR|nr:PadR family transcriptional regulator [Verrucomicrobiota bacterium]
MPEFFDNWTIQMRKGLVEFCILRSLSQSERYGYELVKSLVTLPGLNTSEGTIYPLLSRLRNAGLIEARLVESNEGPARKYYSLTSLGKSQIERMNKYFKTLSHTLSEIGEKGA